MPDVWGADSQGGGGLPEVWGPDAGVYARGQQGEADASPKNRTVLLVLALFAGYLSAHRFYAGKVGQAIGGLVLIFGLFVVWGVGASMLSLELMMSSYAFLLVLGLWWLVDFIMILSGGYRDSERKPISRW